MSDLLYIDLLIENGNFVLNTGKSLSCVITVKVSGRTLFTAFWKAVWPRSWLANAARLYARISSRSWNC